MRALIFILSLVVFITVKASDIFTSKLPYEWDASHQLVVKKEKLYTFFPGSLKDNITLLAHQFGWATVIWQLPYDYQWVGSAQFKENNLKKILRTVLNNFPLQAVFYEGNHVLVITPRNIS